tara:strand:- start:249 stop:1175 length:927 start_codon:yes stop_codon:yes gene_type:complete
MPNYNGVWSLSTQLQYVSDWPQDIQNRGIYAGGLASYAADIQFIHIPSLGNSSDFGDLFEGVSNQPAAASSSTRYLYAGGFNSNDRRNTIQYGNYNGGTGADFGDLTAGKNDLGGLSSETRAVFVGGSTPSRSNVIEYVTIASTGNGTDFGDLITELSKLRAVASTTRGVTMGGQVTNQNQYITIASTGNASDFGDMLVGYTTQGGACSNATRGLYAGGSSGSVVDTIQYITIASTGNCVDFGDLLSADRYNDGVSSSTRAVFLGFSGTDKSEYVTISTTGNAVEFGDLAGNRVGDGAGTSNSHGGLA